MIYGLDVRSKFFKKASFSSENELLKVEQKMHFAVSRFAKTYKGNHTKFAQPLSTSYADQNIATMRNVTCYNGITITSDIDSYF